VLSFEVPSCNTTCVWDATHSGTATLTLAEIAGVADISLQRTFIEASGSNSCVTCISTQQTSSFSFPITVIGDQLEGSLDAFFGADLAPALWELFGTEFATEVTGTLSWSVGLPWAGSVVHPLSLPASVSAVETLQQTSTSSTQATSSVSGTLQLIELHPDQ